MAAVPAIWWEHTVSLTQRSAGMLNLHRIASSPLEIWWMHAIAADLGGA